MVSKRVVSKRVGLGGCSPGTKTGTKTGTRVHSDAPPERKPERGYVPMFSLNENPERGHVRQDVPFTQPPLPDLPFLLFLENGKENQPKNKDLLYLWRTPKIPGKKGQTLKKKEIPCKRKKQGVPKKQGKEDQGLSDFVSSRERRGGDVVN